MFLGWEAVLLSELLRFLGIGKGKWLRAAVIERRVLGEDGRLVVLEKCSGRRPISTTANVDVIGSRRSASPRDSK
jgi:hypothetical protein